MWYVIKSKHGYMRNFDGEDYTWSDDIAKACKMRTRLEATVHYNRIEAIERTAIIEVVE